VDQKQIVPLGARTLDEFHGSIRATAIHDNEPYPRLRREIVRQLRKHALDILHFIQCGNHDQNRARHEADHPGFEGLYDSGNGLLMMSGDMRNTSQTSDDEEMTMRIHMRTIVRRSAHKMRDDA
jgi:hypothetical protein